jgi:spore photoproduct lyase
VINLYLGCPLNCAYCILQAYLNAPYVMINVNIEEIFSALDKVLSENMDKNFRIGTGELGDSLVYDPLTGFSEKFISFFSGYKNAVFEIKTKTDFIENVLKTESPGNIVCGFSMNPQAVISREEEYASSLKERLDAVKKLAARGYKLAFHFDPIVNIRNWKEEYFDVIKMIFTDVRTEDIAWISLGTMRYTRELKKAMEYNYPDSGLLLDEFAECRDEKFRYFKGIRAPIYKNIFDFIKSFDKNLSVYLCMESPELWKSTAGFLPDKNVLKNIF